MADHGTAEEVFTQFLNTGNFPSQGLSFFVGTVGCIFAFAGGDAAVHVRLSISHSNETKANPSDLRCPKKSQTPPLQSQSQSCSAS
jgi:hypothetical protein